MTQVARIIQEVIRRYGEPVEFTPRNSSTTFYIQGSVQRPAEEGLVNDMDQTEFVVYLSVADLTEAPKKFDRLKVRGVAYALDEDATVESLEGTPLTYRLRILG